ncbi:MAG: protein-export chaperone SecB [Mizugakiibacter sp.]|uniref:protein-export chaperone SecB n=1 Tax=Mizugakiibacter sp. TaxID=1972610 RepID=UPI0031BBED6D|nr:protein-export chaperone SecB [Xanthomonadaceae bacterium]
MADNTPAQANGQATQAQLALQKIYVRDASFEAPNAPQIFQEIGESQQAPQVQLNLSHKADQLADGVFEVVLTLTLTCTLQDRTAYLAEVHQAGIFDVVGFADAERDAILGSYCPNVLFPYARQMISDLVVNGGFPPFLLQPINFDALYGEQLRRRAEAPVANA